jgi:hypothetical protein
VIAILERQRYAGCLSYIIAKDERLRQLDYRGWDSQRATVSLSLPSVQWPLQEPLIAGFGERFETEPIGGYGLGTINAAR